MSLTLQPRFLDFEPLEDRLLFSATPVVALDVPDDARIGEEIEVKVSFTNQDPTDQEAGYGPYVDVFINSRGEDGQFDPDTNTWTETPDGLSLSGNTPTYLGMALNFTEIQLNDAANGGKGVAHPFGVDQNGNPIYVKSWDYYFDENGNARTHDSLGNPIDTASDPYFSVIQNGGYRNGDTLLVIELPFGSFTHGQPAAEISFGLTVSNLADLDENLNITAVGGFRFGSTPLNDPTTDPSIIGVAQMAETTVNATLATLTKEYLGPENETATGPNYLRAYRINIDIANGQTLSDLNIFDALPDQAQFVGFGASSHAFTALQTPSAILPGGDLQIRFDTAITGTNAIEDAWIEIQFYVPRVDANGDVINPAVTGDDFFIDNQAYGYGNWDPLDVRDSHIRVGLEAEVSSDVSVLPGDAGFELTPDLDPEHENLEAQSIAIQKSYENLTRDAEIIPRVDSVGGVADWNEIRPDDLLEYTLAFQVSDYFAFGGIVITDILGDGLDFDINSVVLSIDGNTFELDDSLIHGVDYLAVVNPDGTTTVTFNVSSILANRANNGLLQFDNAFTQDQRDADLHYAEQGKLLGGGVNPVFADRIAEIGNSLALAAGFGAGLGYTPYNAQATRGTITYRATVRDDFREQEAGWSPELSLNPRDQINNGVTIVGEVLNLEDADLDNHRDGNGDPYLEDDDSGVGLVIEDDIVRKEIYAVNGDTDLAKYRDHNGNINLQPGDEVTYRIVYVVPTGDVEQLRFTDFLPLPIFNANDPNADGNAQGDAEWEFIGVDGGGDVVTNLIPGAGQVTYGPQHTLNTATTAPDPEISFGAGSVNDVANSITFTLGTAHNTTNQQLVVDLLFTVTVNSNPFADGLYLTNQVQSGERSTQLPQQENEATTNAIVQIVLNQPVVNIYKGVVASDKGPGASAGGIDFNDIGGDGFSGVLAGAANAAEIGALNLDSDLPDAGDTVRFAIVAQNTGRSDAFDVVISDSIPASYDTSGFYADPGNPTASEFIAQTNFKIYRGDGTELIHGVDYTLDLDASGTTFTVTLSDNYVAGNTTDADIKTGGLSRGIDPSLDPDGQPTGQTITNGSNAVVILYDLTIASTAQSSSTVVNTASLLAYAGEEGRENHLSNAPRTDDASVVIAAPTLDKDLTDSLIETGNTLDDAVIGELVEYTLVITLPEGTTSNVTIEDILDSGLAFVRVDSVTFSSGISSSNPDFTATNTADTAPDYLQVSNSGQLLHFELGSLLNSNVNDGASNTITIVYTAVVLNVTTNQAAPDALGNDATMSYEWTNDGALVPGGQADLDAAADRLNIVEPHLDVEKQVNSSFDANSVGYTDSLSGSDAGDTVFYSIVIRNDGTTNAYDISLSDVLPDGLAVGSLTVLGDTVSVGSVWINGSLGTLTAAHFAFTGSTLTFNPGLNIDLAPGAVITIHISGILTTDVRPSEDLHNDAIVTWSSLNGDFSTAQSLYNSASTERGGDAGGTSPSGNTDFSTNDAILDNYAASNRASVVVDVPDNAKSIVATSESFTTVSAGDGTVQVAIGEIVRYQLLVRIPEGTSPDLQVRDNLPPGMVFINDGTATLRFVSTSGTDDLSASAMGGVLANGSTVTLADFNVSTSTTANTDNYGSGTDVYFKLGTVVNSNTDNAIAEYIIIEFNALVLNTNTASPGAPNGNQAGVVLTNSSSTSIDLNGSTTTVGNTASVNAVVVEPNITVDVAAPAGVVDAGDVFTYEITITNNSDVTFGNNAAAAFDVRLQGILDTLRAGNPGVQLEILNIPAGVNINSLGDLSVTAPGYVSLLANSSSAEDLDLTFNRLDVGDSITLQLQVRVVEGAFSGTNIITEAEVSYSSLPGAAGTTAGNAATYGTVVESAITSELGDADTGSSLDLSGVAGERTGADIADPSTNAHPSNSATLNNYAVADRVTRNFAVPTIDKQWQDGSLSDNDSSLPSSTGADVVVGETFTYDLVISLPEGVTSDLQVLDYLPEGFRVDSLQVIKSASVTFENDPSVGFGAVSGSNAELLLDFGDVTVDDSAVTGNVTFTIRVTGTVENIIENQQGTVLQGAARLTYGDPDGNSTGTAVTRNVADGNLANDPSFTVAEPTVQISKNVSPNPVDNPGVTLDAGDILTYSITLSNTSGQTAYELSLYDRIDASLNVVPGVIPNANVITSGAVSGAGDAFEIVEIGGVFYLRTVAGANIDLGNNGTITISFTATIVDDVATSAMIENTAEVRWTSVDGSSGDERGGQGVGEGSAPESFVQGSPVTLNDYALSSTIATSVTNSILANKSLVSTSHNDGDSEVTPGEIVTYRITITVPEGEAPDFRIVDLIPAGMAFIPGSVQVDLAGFNGSIEHNPDLDSQYASALAGGLFESGAGVLFDFGRIVVNADNVAGNNTFSFTYQAVVLDVAAVDGIDDLNGRSDHDNSAWHNNGSGSNLATDFTHGAGTVDLQAVEPQLTITSTLDVTGTVDAGASFTYTITVEHAVTSSADAFDVILSIPVGDLPPEFLASGFTATIDGVPVVGFTLVGNVFTTTGVVNLALNETLEIVISGTLTGEVNPGEVLTAAVDLSYTNLPGDLTVSGGFNPSGDVTSDHERSYTGSSSDDVTAALASFEKTLFLTSDPFTENAEVAIGEIVTYALVVTLPEGTTEGLVITDHLPAGLQYVSHSIVVQQALSEGLLTADFGGVLPVISTFDSTTLTFEFADISVTGDNVAGNNSFIVLVSARVLNIDQNVSTVELSNTATFDIANDGVTSETTAPVIVEIVEPSLSLVKTTETAGADAGDTVVYRLVITNSGTSAAHDVRIQDFLDAALELASPASAISISGGPAYAILDQSANAATLIDTVLNRLNAGDSITLLITARVTETAVAGDTISNTASISYTSLSGDHDPGSSTGERDGSGGHNDHITSDSSDDFTLETPTIDKKTPLDTTYAIGEIVTYDIEISLPEGTTRDLVILDNLPAGLVYESFEIVSGSFSGSPLTAPTVSVLAGNVVSFAFGDVLTGATSGTVDNVFTLRVSARVDNILPSQGADSPNPGATTFSNTAVLQYTDGTLPGTTDVTDPTAPGPITVVEPVMEFSKTALTPVSGLDAGDTVQYQITFTNTGTSTAHDVTLRDQLPAGLIITSIDAVNVSNGATTDVAIAGVAGDLLTGEFTVPVGGTVTITYTVTLQNSVTPDTSYTNEASIVWSSLDGPSIHERDGADGEQHDGSLNDYGLSDSVTAQTSQTFELEKVADKSTVTIGEVITYTLTLTLNEGTTNNVQIIDTLPVSGGNLQLEFIPGSSQISYGTLLSSMTGSHVPTVGGAQQEVLTFQLGSVVIPADQVGANNTVTITYQVRVTDVGVTDGGDTLSNAADGSATGVLPDDGNSAIVNVIEPDLVLTKGHDDADGVISRGQDITYVVDVFNQESATGSTAYNVVISDTMLLNGAPSALALSELGALVVNLYDMNGTLGTGDDVFVQTLAVGTDYIINSHGTDGWTITLTGGLNENMRVSVSYTATFAISLSAADAIDNNARVSYTSLQDPLGEDVRHYDPDAGVEAYNVSSDDRQDTERVTVGTSTIGDRVWYDFDGDGAGGDFGEETGLSGVRVWIDIDGSGDFDATRDIWTLTAADGSYELNGIAAGTYTVMVDDSTLPDGALTLPTYDRDGTYDGVTTGVTVSNGQSLDDIDFGFRGTGTIGDLVWNDLDGNGVRNLGEPGVDGVNLEIWLDVDGDGVIGLGDYLLATTTTSNAGGFFGSYLFENLLAADYLVRVTDDNFLPGAPLENTIETWDFDDGNPALITTPRVAAVTLASAEDQLNVDFGFQGNAVGNLGSVADLVWYDINGDGVQDPGELGIPDVTLYIDQNNNGIRDAFEAYAITDQNGHYLISGLVSGNYTLRIDETSLPDGAVATFANDTLFDGADATTWHVATFTLAAGEDRSDLDFGYRGANSIGDLVWHDKNKNGLLDLPREMGMPDIKVNLYWDSNGNGILDSHERSVSLLTDITDLSGAYLFDNLFAGTYFIEVDMTTLPKRHVPTFDLDGIASPHFTVVTLTAGTNVTNSDFGYVYVPVPTFFGTPSTPVFETIVSPSVVGSAPASIIPGFSNAMVSMYFQTQLDPTFDPWILDDWELVDSTPIFSSPLLSGHAEPGSKVVLSLYNHRGELISSSTVLVGSGGNWTTGFSGVQVNGPITIVSSVTSNDFTAFSSDDNFNYRTNYITGLAGGYFQSRLPNVEEALSGLAYERLAVMEGSEDDTSPWVKSEFEFLAEPALPGK